MTGDMDGIIVRGVRYVRADDVDERSEQIRRAAGGVSDRSLQQILDDALDETRRDWLAEGNHRRSMRIEFAKLVAARALVMLADQHAAADAARDELGDTP